MLKLLKERIVKCQKGAMDKILVTLLLVIVGVAAVVGLNTWITGEVDNVKTSASSQISSVTNNAAGN